MGADGHIRFYDQGKVDKICGEINLKHGLKGNKQVHFPGYKCNFRVNGQPCYLIYWESQSMDSWHNWDFQETKTFLRIKKEFENRCNAEAILVEDQEVWT